MITLTNVTKRFGSTLALDNVSFAIPDHAITALVGANGAGKTTLLKIMTRLIDYDSGHIEYGNYTSLKDFRKGIGYLPEQRGLYSGVDIETQLIHFASIRGLSKKAALHNIAYWLRKFDIQSWSKRNITGLSKGMQQKIQLISSLVSMPRLVFMDEPLSGLDPVNFRYFCSILKEYREDFDATIVLSTHNMKSVEQICSMVAILNKAKLHDFGAITDLKQKYSTLGSYIFVVKKSKSINLDTPSMNDQDFSIQYEDINSEIVQIELTSKKHSSSLLEALDYIIKKYPDMEIISCSESIPTMEDIFIGINN